MNCARDGYDVAQLVANLLTTIGVLVALVQAKHARDAATEESKRQRKKDERDDAIIDFDIALSVSLEGSEHLKAAADSARGKGFGDKEILFMVASCLRSRGIGGVGGANAIPVASALLTKSGFKH